MRGHTGEKWYQCKKCGERFKCFMSLKYHELHGTREERYHCVFCDKGFAREHELRFHILREIGEMWYSCHDCREKFSSPAVLREHQIMHHPPKFGYEKCDRVFGSLRGKKIHAWYIHGNLTSD